jgi:hypothetical protein
VSKSGWDLRSNSRRYVVYHINKRKWKRTVHDPLLHIPKKSLDQEEKNHLLHGDRDRTVKSDHRPLVYLFSMKNPSSKLTRMRLDLEEFDFHVEYIQGKNNTGADALSRLDVEELRELQHCQAQVMAMQTRSMTRKNAMPSKQTNELSDLPQVYEVIENFEVYRLPKLLFIMDTQYPRVQIKAHNSKRARININLDSSVTKEELALAQVISRLERIASEQGINKVQLELDSQIFKYVPLSEFKAITNNTLKSLKILLTKPIEKICETTKKQELITKFHRDPILGGHCGKKRLLTKLRSYYYWKNMQKDIAKFVKTCHECQVNKAKVKNIEPMCITPSPQNAFDIVIIDTIGPFIRTSSGNAYAVTMECELTKYLVTVPIPNKEAKTVANAIFENFILVYGPMKEIRTDMGTEYINETLTELNKLFDINHMTSTPYRPQTVGTVERNHRVLNEYLRMYINDYIIDWDTWMKYFTYCYNTTPSTVHNYCPFELVFAKKPNLPSDFLSSHIDPLYNVESYAKEVKYRLQTALARSNQYLQQIKHKRKTNHDKQARMFHVNPNDLVLVKSEVRQKFDPVFSVCKIMNVVCSLAPI